MGIAQSIKSDKPKYSSKERMYTNNLVKKRNTNNKIFKKNSFTNP